MELVEKITYKVKYFDSVEQLIEKVKKKLLFHINLKFNLEELKETKFVGCHVHIVMAVLPTMMAKD